MAWHGSENNVGVSSFYVGFDEKLQEEGIPTNIK